MRRFVSSAERVGKYLVQLATRLSQPVSPSGNQYPSLFQGPKPLGFLAWELAPAHRPLLVALMDPAVTILPRKRSALPQLGREEAPCRGARHDESFGRPSDICLRDRVGHGDRAGGSEAANLIEASREGAWGCAAELLPHII